MSEPVLTFLMPCLNEERTVGKCIKEASDFLSDAKISGEILIADNGSVDASVSIAKSLGARVIHVDKKGYGSALRAGIQAAKGKYIIMGDSDCSYDFYHVDDFVKYLELGFDLVMGNRLDHIEEGAMPPSHRYFGVPALSMLARVRYDCYITDWHCGIRGFNTEAIRSLDLQCDGMEFATEMIAKVSREKLSIAQVDVRLRKDERNRKPHLRSIPDGLRHMRYILFGDVSC